MNASLEGKQIVKLLTYVDEICTCDGSCNALQLTFWDHVDQTKRSAANSRWKWRGARSPCR